MCVSMSDKGDFCGVYVSAFEVKPALNQPKSCHGVVPLKTTHSTNRDEAPPTFCRNTCHINKWRLALPSRGKVTAFFPLRGRNGAENDIMGMQDDSENKLPPILSVCPRFGRRF